MALANWTTGTAAEEGFLNQDVVLLVGRVLLGGPFLISGTQKLLTASNFADGLATPGIPEFLQRRWRISARPSKPWAVSGRLRWCDGVDCTVDDPVHDHARRLFLTGSGSSKARCGRRNTRTSTKNLMIIGGFCVLHVAGSGRYSIDGWRRNRL